MYQLSVRFINLVFLLFLFHLSLLFRFSWNLIVDLKDKPVNGLDSIVDKIISVVSKDQSCRDIHEEVLSSWHEHKDNINNDYYLNFK